MLSGAVRSRRPPSPPPNYHQSLPRFPSKEGHLDADERRAAASFGYGPSRKSAHGYGGFNNISSGEWKLLIVLVVIASAVRLFRISKPDSVVCVVSLSPSVEARSGELIIREHRKTSDSTKSTSASSLRDTSRRVTSWTFTRHWPSSFSRWLLSSLGLMETLILRRLQSRFL
jgi:hypothetical protein